MGPLTPEVNASTGDVTWHQQFGAFMKQHGGSRGEVVLRTGNTPLAGTFAFNVTG